MCEFCTNSLWYKIVSFIGSFSLMLGWGYLEKPRNGEFPKRPFSKFSPTKNSSVLEKKKIIHHEDCIPSENWRNLFVWITRLFSNVNLSSLKELWRKIALDVWTVVAISRLCLTLLNEELCIRYYGMGKCSNFIIELLFLFYKKKILMAQNIIFKILRQLGQI